MENNNLKSMKVKKVCWSSLLSTGVLFHQLSGFIDFWSPSVEKVVEE
jgi:hypothetical protein